MFGIFKSKPKPDPLTLSHFKVSKDRRKYIKRHYPSGGDDALDTMRKGFIDYMEMVGANVKNTESELRSSLAGSEDKKKSLIEFAYSYGVYYRGPGYVAHKKSKDNGDFFEDVALGVMTLGVYALVDWAFSGDDDIGSVSRKPVLDPYCYWHRVSGGGSQCDLIFSPPIRVAPTTCDKV